MINKNKRKELRLKIFNEVIEEIEEDNLFIVDDEVKNIIKEGIKRYIILCEKSK